MTDTHQPTTTETPQPTDIQNAGYSQISGGPGVEVLAWKCPHFSVYSAVHTFSPEVPDEHVEEARTNLLAYYELAKPCSCTPVLSPV